MADTIKAVRATIALGDIPLNVYRLPDGGYKLAGRNVTDAVEEPNNSLIRLYGVKSLKQLPGADLTLKQVKAETGETFIPVAIPDAFKYWFEMAKRDNLKAEALIIACGSESIERRADAVFGVVRTEDERNKSLKSLIDRILEDPKTWTMHFKPRWREDACRVTGYKWHPSRPMAQFISTYIYKALPPAVYAKLMEVNSDRKARHHQFFDSIADEVVLKEHIQQVGGLLRIARNKAHFKQLFADAFSEGIQCEIDIDDDDMNAA